MEINGNTFSQNVQDLAKADDKKANGPMGQVVSNLAHQKNSENMTASSANKNMNAAILQSAVEVNLSAGNESLSLVFKTALEGINEALKESTGDENSIHAAYETGIDVSPEATANRIVSLSTTFFYQYQESHPEMELDEALSSFVEVISGGINKGFSEAREILTGLTVLEGDIASDIDQTYELVQQKLESFVESFENAETS